MVTITMVYDQLRPEERMLLQSAEKLGVDLTPLSASELTVEVSSREKPSEIGDAVLQRCVSYFRNLHLTAALEAKGIPVVNSFNSTLTCGNKLFVTLALMKAGVPTPKTYVAFTTKGGLKALEQLGYPAMLKPVVGSWGRMVAPLKDADSAKALFEDREYMYPIYQVLYIQEMVKRPPRDIRCFVVGDEAIAAIYRYAPLGEWRTNTARGGRAENCPITSEIEELALKAAKAIGDGVYGVDMMESGNGLVVHEVNHTVEFRNSVPVTGVDIPGKILEYVVSKAKR